MGRGLIDCNKKSSFNSKESPGMLSPRFIPVKMNTLVDLDCKRIE